MVLGSNLGHSAVGDAWDRLKSFGALETDDLGFGGSEIFAVLPWHGSSGWFSK